LGAFSPSSEPTLSFQPTMASPPFDSSITATITPGNPLAGPFSKYASTVATANCNSLALSAAKRFG
jgi:hypothetical protein